jgi:hypothetical protein
MQLPIILPSNEQNVKPYLKKHMMHALLLGGANLVKKPSISAEVLLLIEQAVESTKVH